MLRHLCRLSSNYFPKNDLRFASVATAKSKKVAVVLAGSGVYDGSEIHEASAVLSHLTRQGLEPQCYAPDICQLHVIDHTKGAPAENESRNVLVESARIARGNIRPLTELTECEADAVIFPGGFGAAKNLSNFAEKGENCEVEEDVARVLTAFHKAKKPIGLCCIAPVLAAKVFCNVTITLGKEDDGCGNWPFAGTLAQAKAMGANVECKNVDEISFDKDNLVVTTPAFMYAGQFHEIYDGIGLMICKIASLLNN